jgi:very-short-patch-repair endonuclease
MSTGQIRAVFSTVLIGRRARCARLTFAIKMTTMRNITLPMPGQSLVAWSRSTWHAYPSSELIALFSRRQFERAVRDGELVAVAPNSYVAACHAESLHARVDAALLWAGTPAAIGGQAALCLHGILDSCPAVVEVVVPRDRHLKPVPSRLRTRRTDYIFEPVQVGGWTVVPAAMALCQAFWELGTQRTGVTLRALANKAVGVEDLCATLTAMPRVRGRKQLTSLLAHFAAGSESYLEVVAVSDVFRGHDFAQLVRQHEVVAHGRRYRLDLYDEQTMTAIETDGAAYHAGPTDWQRDLNRDADLSSLGILTVRFSYSDLMQNPERCRARVRAIIASRRRVMRR